MRLLAGLTQFFSAISVSRQYPQLVVSYRMRLTQLMAQSYRNWLIEADIRSLLANRYLLSLGRNFEPKMKSRTCINLGKVSLGRTGGSWTDQTVGAFDLVLYIVMKICVYNLIKHLAFLIFIRNLVCYFSGFWAAKRPPWGPLWSSAIVEGTAALRQRRLAVLS